MYPVVIVLMDRVMNGFDKLSGIRKPVKLKSQICLEIVEEGFLIPIFPRRGFCTHGDGNADTFHEIRVVTAGIFHPLIRMDKPGSHQLLVDQCIQECCHDEGFGVGRCHLPPHDLPGIPVHDRCQVDKLLLKGNIREI